MIGVVVVCLSLHVVLQRSTFFFLIQLALTKNASLLFHNLICLLRMVSIYSQIVAPFFKCAWKVVSLITSEDLSSYKVIALVYKMRLHLSRELMNKVAAG